MDEVKEEVANMVADTCCNGQIEGLVKDGAVPSAGWLMHRLRTVGVFEVYAFWADGPPWKSHVAEFDSLWVVRKGLVRLETPEGTRIANPNNRTFIPEGLPQKCLPKPGTNGYILYRKEVDPNG